MEKVIMCDTKKNFYTRNKSIRRSRDSYRKKVQCSLRGATETTQKLVKL